MSSCTFPVPTWESLIMVTAKVNRFCDLFDCLKKFFYKNLREFQTPKYYAPASLLFFYFFVRLRFFNVTKFAKTIYSYLNKFLTRFFKLLFNYYSKNKCLINSKVVGSLQRKIKWHLTVSFIFQILQPCLKSSCIVLSSFLICRLSESNCKLLEFHMTLIYEYLNLIAFILFSIVSLKY